MKYLDKLLIFSKEYLQNKRKREIIKNQKRSYKVRSDFRIFQSTSSTTKRREEQQKMKQNQVQKYSEIVFLFVLLAGNTFSLYNSFEIFHFQYNRHPDQKEQIEQQFNHLTNGYKISTFWFYMNLKLAFNLLSELILFIIISLKVSDQKYHQYYIVQMVLVILQLLVTFQSIWPFSSHSQYGFDFEKKKKLIINQCHSGDESYTQLVCNFSDSIFYMIKCAQALIIIAFISLSGISASSFLKNRHSSTLNDRLNKIRSRAINCEGLENENGVNKTLLNYQTDAMIQTNSVVTYTKMSESVIRAQEKRKVESVKGNAKYEPKNQNSKNNSFARTETSSQAEDSQSDIDYNRQPNYIQYSNSNKKIQGERSQSEYPSSFNNQPTLYAGYTNSSSYQPPLFSNGKNPRLSNNKHYLDRSLDDDQLDIEENRQL